MPQAKRTPNRSKALARASARKVGDMERRDPDLPPVGFERDTGWPASKYQEWLAAEKAKQPKRVGRNGRKLKS